MISYTDGAITSGITRHTAERIAGDGDTWVVSWLSGRRLSRNQATTAMVLAEYVANYWNGREVVGMDEHRFRLFTSQWADELSVQVDEAIGWICRPDVAG